jgi:hypothetical protein
LIQVDQLCIPISMGIREKKSMVQQTGWCRKSLIQLQELCNHRNAVDFS